MDNPIFTGRGTTALWLLLSTLSYDNSKILLPVNICEVVVAIIRTLDLEPIFYDIDPISGNAGLEHIQEKWTEEQLLLVTHNFGQPVGVDKIVEWAEARNIFVIEDVCNAYGAVYKGKALGEYGHAAIYSFGYAKIIEVGVGGALTVKDAALHHDLILLNDSLPVFDSERSKKMEHFSKELSMLRERNYDIPEDYCSLYDSNIGLFLYKISNADKKRILDGISKLEMNLSDRNHKSNLYRQNICNKKISHRPIVPGEVVWRYTCICSDEKFRNKLIEALRNINVLVSTWYPRVDKLFGYQQGDFVGGEFFENHVINFFVDHRVTIEDVEMAISAVNNHKGC